MEQLILLIGAVVLPRRSDTSMKIVDKGSMNSWNFGIAAADTYINTALIRLVFVVGENPAPITMLSNSFCVISVVNIKPRANKGVPEAIHKLQIPPRLRPVIHRLTIFLSSSFGKELLFCSVVRLVVVESTVIFNGFAELVLLHRWIALSLNSALNLLLSSINL